MALKRATMYARVSTDMQARIGESIPAQIDRLYCWARDNGYIVVQSTSMKGNALTSDRKENRKDAPRGKGAAQAI